MPLTEAGPLQMRPGSEPWVAVLLMWLGYSLIVGLIARAIVPLPRPPGTFATLLVGLVGATLAPFILEWAAFGRSVSPLRPEAFLTAVGVATACLLFYRLSQLRSRDSHPQQSPKHEPQAGAKLPIERL